MGSDFVDLRIGRSEIGSGGSAVAFNALILCVIKALCLFLGVVGRTDKDCDLVGAMETMSNSSAVSSSDCDNQVSIDVKLSSAGDTRGRGGLKFRPLSCFSGGAFLRSRNGETVEDKDKGNGSSKSS